MSAVHIVLSPAVMNKPILFTSDERGRGDVQELRRDSERLLVSVHRPSRAQADQLQVRQRVRDMQRAVAVSGERPVRATDADRVLCVHGDSVGRLRMLLADRR